MGKIKFWIFPNLDNEKLGFIDSFKPFYSFEYKDATKGSKGKKKKKDKGSSGKPSGETEPSAIDDEDGGNEQMKDEGVDESEEVGEKVETKQTEPEQVVS